MTTATATDFARLAHDYQAAVDEGALVSFAESVGVTAESLKALGIGRNDDAWTFPERNASGEIIGVSRRPDRGKKHMVTGSRRGLTMMWPLDAYAGSSANDPILLVEGPTDTATGLDFGFSTIGRLSATGGADHLRPLLRGRHICIVGEHERSGVGKSGAKRIAQALLHDAASVQLMFPPAEYKDLRAWAQHADRAKIKTAIRAAEKVQALRQLSDFPLTDYANAERLVHRHGEKLRYCHQTGQWYVWDRIRWRPDDTGAVMRLAKETLRQLFKIALRLPQDRKDFGDKLIAFARRSERSARLNAMIELARSEREVVVSADDLDADPWALNVRNGIIDLRTGKLRPHDPAELHTRLAPVSYDPNAICPDFDTFLDETTCGSEGLATYLQQLLGLCLTGDISEQILPVWWGTGSNGKNTLLDLILAILGDYAGLAAPDLLVAKQWTQHPTELADLHGKRLVVASETERHQHLRVQFVKQVTGDKRLKARFMRGNFFEFDRQFKVILVTNNRPIIDEQTHAIWRRIKLVPFTNVVPDEKQDKKLPKKLLDEAPGVLAWLVRGCTSYQREGLITPGEVVEATDDYKAESNWLERFIAECLNFVSGLWTPSYRLTDTFNQWCRENGIEHSTVSELYPHLRHEGCKQHKSCHVRGWQGVSIVGNEPDDEERTT